MIRTHLFPLFIGQHIFEFGIDSTEIFEFLKGPRCVSHHRVRLHGAHHPRESDSAVCIIPRVKLAECIPPQCVSHCGVKFSGVHHPAESDSAVCIIPQSQAPQCASHSGVRLHGVHPSAESSSVVCIIPRSHQLTKCQFSSKVLKNLFLCDA